MGMSCKSQFGFSFSLTTFLLCFIVFQSGGGLGGRKESGQLRFGGRERPFRAPLYVASTYLCILQHLFYCVGFFSAIILI